MHVIYSELIEGAGILAGGPFYCTENGVDLNNNACTTEPQLIDVNYLEKATKVMASVPGWIGDVNNLKDSKVWLFSGKVDSTVVQGVTNKVRDFYSYYGANVEYINGIQAEHGFPSDLPQNTLPCNKLSKPWIYGCNYDGAGHLLKHVLGRSLKPRDLDWKNKGTLYQFDQTEFVATEDWVKSSFDETGFVYVPKWCEDNGGCDIHMVFHGCSMGYWNLGTTWVVNTGYLEWAATNNLVVVYPQITKTDTGYQYPGCWDFWGYSGENYLSRVGIQPVALSKMISRLQK